MAGFSERLAYLISANADQAISEFRRVNNAADKELGAVDAKIGRFGNIGGKFKGAAAGAAAGVGGIFAAEQILAFGADAINVAREIELLGVKTDVVFGEAAADVRAWADENNESLGMTKERLAGVGAGFADLLVPMGFTRQEAAEMTKDVIGLSGALSAWSAGKYNTAEVSQILAKAMLGEREQLKELGISISEADVQSRLAEKGQKGLTGALKEQAEAVATQELLFNKSKDAQEAWANGSLDAIKAQNELRAELEAKKQVLGEQLIPLEERATEIATDTVQGVNSLADAWDKFGKFTSGGLRSVGGLVFGLKDQKDASDAAAAAAANHVGWLDRLGDASRQVSKYNDDLAGSTVRTSDAFDEAAEAAERFGDAIDDQIDRTFDLARAQRDVDDAYDELSDDAADAAERRADAEERVADAIESSSRRIRDAKQDLADAEEDLQKIASGDRTAARRRVRDAEQEVADAQADGAEAVAEAKSEQADLNVSAEEQLELVEDIGEGVAEVVKKMKDEGKSAEEILAYLDQQKIKLEEHAAQLGLNRQEVEKILALWQLIAGIATPNPGDSPFGSVSPSGGLPPGALDTALAGGALPGIGVLNVYTSDDPLAIAHAVSREVSLFGGRR